MVAHRCVALTTDEFVSRKRRSDCQMAVVNKM